MTISVNRLPGGFIQIRGRVWSGTFHQSLLADWIAFYERMHRLHGKGRYQEIAAALKSTQEASE